jgi:hypothetical protein
MGPSLIGEAMADLTRKTLVALVNHIESHQLELILAVGGIAAEHISAAIQLVADIELLVVDEYDCLRVFKDHEGKFVAAYVDKCREKEFTADTLPAALRKAAAARAEWEAKNAK